MLTLSKIHGRQILDSRGNPTVEVDVVLSDSSFGRAAVPSGASTGTHEALELRDHDDHSYGGKGVLKAIGHIENEIAQALVGMAVDQQAIDQKLIELDGTPNKNRLGANAILAVSLAVARALSNAQNTPLYKSIRTSYGIVDNQFILPVPMMNFVNGGKHASNNLDFQEFMIVPYGASTFAEALQWGAEVYMALKKMLEKSGQSTLVGDEGGFAPNLPSNNTALALLKEAVEHAGYNPGKDIGLAIDSAAMSFFEDGKYILEADNKTLDNVGMIELYQSWVEHFPIISLEDPLAEDDWQGFTDMTSKLGTKVQIVGDDLFVTNTKRLEKGIAEKACNAILIKVNQIGTLTETVQAVQLAHDHGYQCIISHRSGETEDTTIADLAVALNTGQIKTGSLSRSERTAKYNQLLRIEEELNSQAHYAGKTPYKL